MFGTKHLFLNVELYEIGITCFSNAETYIFLTRLTIFGTDTCRKVIVYAHVLDHITGIHFQFQFYVNFLWLFLAKRERDESVKILGLACQFSEYIASLLTLLDFQSHDY